MNSRATRAALLALILLTLWGCAAQSAFQDGQSLVTRGDFVSGITKLEEAVSLEPRNAQYRAAVIQARERQVVGLLVRAEELVRAGRLDAAESTYKQALQLHPGNDNARAGLQRLRDNARATSLMADAKSAWARKDADAGRQAARAALLLEPGRAEARELLETIARAAEAPPSPTALATAYRKPITIEFKDVGLRTVFEVISRTSGLNFIFDKDVRTDQKTSIFLKNSTIENAVNLTMLTNQLAQRVLDANTIVIYPNTPAKQKDYQPLLVRSFYLANADAKTVAASMKALLKSRDVVIDEKLNLVILRDSPEAIRLAEKLVAVHDIPESEVMLEVEILEVKRTRLQDLGIRWPEQLTLTPLASAAGSALTLADLRNLNSSSLSAVIGPVTLSARSTGTDANILANPRIRARNREKARVLIGERVPNITTTSTSTGFVSESVNYVDVGLKLEVEPTIYLDGDVAIKIALEVSNIIGQIQTKTGTAAYQIGTRTAQTVLRLKDGENQVLAGLINDEDRRSGDRVPGLGEIPVVGRLFGSHRDDGSKTEIVLSITPRVIRTVRRPDASFIEFESGTENSLGSAQAGVGASAADPSGVQPNRGPAPAIGNARAPGAGALPAATAQGGGVPSAAPNLASTSLRWQGPLQARVGEVLKLQLVAQGGQAVTSFPMALAFNPGVLQVVSVQEGEFLRQGGASTNFSSRVDATGQVHISAARTGDLPMPSSDVVATVTVRVTSAIEPETSLRVISASPTGAAGLAIPLAPPPPHTLRISP